MPDDELRGQAKQPRNGDDIGVMDDCNREQEPAVTLHLVPEDVWLAQKDESWYLPDGFSSEGFIHCTDGDDVCDRGRETAITGTIPDPTSCSRSI